MKKNNAKKTAAKKAISPKVHPINLKFYNGKAIKRLKRPVVAKAGTYRRVMLDALVSSKTCDEAQNKLNKDRKFSGRPVCFRWAQAQGYVKILGRKAA